MKRPSILHIGGVLYWTMRTRNPDTQILKDADSTPTVSIRKNGAAVGDSVTVTKRAATTGIYDCSYNPAGEVEGDEFTVEEAATVTGTTTAQATYSNSWEFTVLAQERGTDGANTTTPPTASANATAVRSELAIELSRVDTSISSRASQTSVDGKPTLVQIEASTILAKESTVNAVGSIVATISSNVTTLLARITSGVATMFLDLIQMITGSGTANAQWTAKALENAGGGGGGTGTGARLVSITVLLDAVAQQSARVRLTKGAETYLATTDVNGLATFNVDDGSWTVSITLAGATFAGATLVVDGNETVSYSMTSNPAISASDPDKVTGYWLCLSHLGVPESGVTVTLTAMSLPANSTGLVLDSASRSVVSGVDGVVSFTNLIPGVRYKVVRNSGKAFYFVCPDYQADPVDLASFIGT